MTSRARNRLPFLPLTTLYVGDIGPDVTEAFLYEIFTPAAQIMSLKVCRDLLTQQSLGYGYVNFYNSADAERVLDTMNFDLVKGRPMRLMWSQRDPSLRRSGLGNVFIKNLDKTIDNKAMYDTFSAFGYILSCKVATDDDGFSKGYGFVHFENVESANKAIEKVNGMLLNGKKVYVGKFVSKAEREQELGARAKLFTNVYVKNFGRSLNEEQFYNLFKKFGQITSCAIAKNPDGTSKGFGFVAYGNVESAQKAVNEMNNFLINDTPIYVGKAQKKAERVKELKKNYELIKIQRCNRVHGTNIYVKNLDDAFDDEKLRKEFSPFGTITSAKVMMDGNRSKGFGFVNFSTPDEATKAIHEMDTRMIGSKPLYVSLAQTFEERRAYLSAQCLQRLRQQQNMISPFAPQLIMPNLQPRNRFLNHMVPIRPAPRWSTSNLPRMNGTYNNPLISSTPYRPPNTRPLQINNARNVRPITARPSNKYTANSIPIERSTGALSNVGDAPNCDDKNLIGTTIYRIIEQTYPEKAAKITGMLLEIENDELKSLLKNRDLLNAKIEEAVAVLEEHKAD